MQTFLSILVPTVFFGSLLWGGIAIYSAVSRLGKFKAMVLSEGAPDYSLFGFGSGVAISRVRRTLYLNHGSRRAKYSFDDVREWSIKELTGGKAVGAGFYGGMAALGHNKREAQQAAMASGLFVSVRDIENPEWQVQMPQKLQQTWFEILNQFIKEESTTP